MKVTIEGVQAAQKANLQIIKAVKPTSGLGRWANYTAVAMHRYVVSITHVVTGTLRAAHRISIEGPAKYRISIDPAAVNPLGGYPSLYGVMEHNRGGSHAFYERGVSEYPSALSSGATQFLRELP